MAERCFRRVIKIRGNDSPNVRYGLAEESAGIVPTDEMLVPGVLGYREYLKRLATWDKIRICIGIHADFYEGKEVLLFPPQWLNRAEELALLLRGRPRQAEAVGIDPAEGGDKTAMSAVDRHGLIEITSKKTPDTNAMLREAIAFCRKHGVVGDPSDLARTGEKVVWDRGGGGKQRADDMRAMGWKGVRTLAFGSPPSLDPKRGMRLVEEKMGMKEEHYAYVNMRAEMYGDLSVLLDPSHEFDSNDRTGVLKGVKGFAIPSSTMMGGDETYDELRRQLAPIPKTYDPEGRLKLLPKHKRTPDSTERTLAELMGCSPDEADSLVLAVHAMLTVPRRHVAGGF